MSLERVLMHTTACSCQYEEPGSGLQSPDFTAHRICHQPMCQHRPPWQSSGGFCSPPCHLVLGTSVLPSTSNCCEIGGRAPADPDYRLSPCGPVLGACGVPPSERVWDKLTFSAKTGFPESSVRCKNSKCREPNSARMLLLPAVAQPQLPLKRHPMSPCWLPNSSAQLILPGPTM